MNAVRPTLRSVLARLTLAALPLLAAGCDPLTAQSLAEKVVFDMTKHAFIADRHFTCDLDGKHVDYLERVHSAGDGRQIRVELLALNGQRRDQITDPTQLKWFDNLDAALQSGGGPRALFQRDPSVDDLDHLLANYDVIPIQLGREDIRRGGEPTLTVKLEPRLHDRSFYVLTVSTVVSREGFPIEAQEYVYDVNGPRLVSEMKVVRLDYGNGNGSETDHDSPILSRTPLASVADASARARQRGLQLLLPKDGSLPIGFQLARIEEVELKTTANPQHLEQVVRLYRFVYSDGIEHIDFIEHAAPDNAFSSRFQDVAAVTRFGTISIASLFHLGTQVVIESRLSNDRFASLLKSLVNI